LQGTVCSSKPARSVRARIGLSIPAADSVVSYNGFQLRPINRQPHAAQIFISTSHQEPSMARYGKAASAKVEKVMKERNQGTLRSGRSGKKVTSRKQAIAIGLSEARKSGAKVPPRRRKAAKAS
jgi:hypothetical protein